MNVSRKLRNGNLAATVIETVRENPIATVLMGAGCLLLLANNIRRGQRMAQQLQSSVREYPAVCIAAGVAFGAAIAALLPESRMEDELLHPVSATVQEKLADLVSRNYQQAKAEAGKAAQELMSVAAREGLAAFGGASAYPSDALAKARQPG